MYIEKHFSISTIIGFVIFQSLYYKSLWMFFLKKKVKKKIIRINGTTFVQNWMFDIEPIK
jgi:hypothetical protein